MTDKLASVSLERLSQVRSIEADLLDRVDQLRGSGGAGPEAADGVARMSALAARHAHALEELAGRRVPVDFGMASPISVRPASASNEGQER